MDETPREAIERLVKCSHCTHPLAVLAMNLRCLGCGASYTTEPAHPDLSPDPEEPMSTTPTWMSEQPTTAGWWWVLTTPDGYDPVPVFFDGDGIYFGGMGPKFRMKGFLWAGPITMPAMPSANPEVSRPDYGPQPVAPAPASAAPGAAS